jgi:NarL family two-component system response regulator LiaR
MIQIAIVEDSSQYLKVLKTIINSHSEYKCDWTYIDAESILEDLENLKLDIIFVDLQLPNMTGEELTYQLRKRKNSAKIIICSSFDDTNRIFQSLRNGADGYLLKSSTPEQIHQAIEDVLNGGAPMSQSIARKVISHFYIKEDNRESLELLTPKEKEILELLGSGLLYKEIADRQGSAMETIKKHFANIYKKLQVNNRTEALNIFFNHNYK